MVGVGEIDLVWGDVGGDYYCIEVGQCGDIGYGVQFQFYVGFGQFVFEVVQGFVEFFFVGDVFGYVELVVDFVVGVKQCYLVFVFGGYGCVCQVGWFGVDYGYVLCGGDWVVDQFGFMYCLWVDQVIGGFVFEYVIQVGLVVCDVGID